MRPRRRARMFHALASCADHRGHCAPLLRAIWGALAGPPGRQDWRTGLAEALSARPTTSASGLAKRGILGLGGYPSALGFALWQRLSTSWICQSTPTLVISVHSTRTYSI